MEEKLLINQIKKVKELHDKTALEEILLKINPLIKNYARKLFFIDKEDAEQELNLTLIEAIYSIKKYDNEAMCFSYLQKCIINKYNYLCKVNIKNSKYINVFIDLPDSIPLYENYNEIELYADIQTLLKDKNDTQKNIITYIFLYNLSDNEISSKMHISRQYVHRVKKRILKEYFH